MMMLDGRSKQLGFNFMLPRSVPGRLRFRFGIGANEVGIILFHESKPNFSNDSIKSLNFAEGYMECISITNERYSGAIATQPDTWLL